MSRKKNKPKKTFIDSFGKERIVDEEYTDRFGERRINEIPVHLIDKANYAGIPVKEYCNKLYTEDKRKDAEKRLFIEQEEERGRIEQRNNKIARFFSPITFILYWIWNIVLSYPLQRNFFKGIIRFGILAYAGFHLEQFYEWLQSSLTPCSGLIIFIYAITLIIIAYVFITSILMIYGHMDGLFVDMETYNEVTGKEMQFTKDTIASKLGNMSNSGKEEYAKEIFGGGSKK